MAWCKRDVSDFFRWNFFSFKSAWIFACAFQLSRKTFSCSVFWLKCSCSALLCSLCTLQYFVFVFLRNKVQTRQKKYRGMLYYLIEKHMKKFRHFWRKKILPEKVTYVPLAPSHSIIGWGWAWLSWIIKTEVCVICWSRVLRQIKHRHEVLIIHDIMRKPNSINVLLYIFHIIHPEKQKWSVQPFCFWGEHSKELSNQADIELDVINVADIAFIMSSAQRRVEFPVTSGNSLGQSDYHHQTHGI